VVEVVREPLIVEDKPAAEVWEPNGVDDVDATSNPITTGRLTIAERCAVIGLHPGLLAL